MTDKEIIRALRLCGKIDSNCRECKLWGVDRCVEHLAGAAADLIERLTAENVALREGASLGKVKRSQKQAYEKQIESLQALANRQLSEIKKLQKDLCWKDLEVDAAEWKQERAEAERDALREKQRWIPVTERMPNTIPCNAGTEYSEAVIVWTTGNKAMIAVWDGIDFICPTDFWEAWGEEITHWMPLPEVPEEVLPKNMADEIALKLMRLADLEAICSFARLRELAEADKDGRVVILPCKVGDTVWFKTYKNNARDCIGVQPHEVTRISASIIVPGEIVDIGIPVDQIGVRVFLSETEAVAADAKPPAGNSILEV